MRKALRYKKLTPEASIDEEEHALMLSIEGKAMDYQSKNQVTVVDEKEIIDILEMDEC